MSAPRGRLTPYVSLGAAAGALVRAGLVEVSGGHDAAALLAVNVLGSFVLGVLPVFGAVRRSERLTALLGPGFLGGFTTVSGYALAAHSLGHDGVGPALTYVALTFAAALAAAALGRRLVGRAEAR